MRRLTVAAGLVALSVLAAAALLAQARPDAFGVPLTHPAIGYGTRPTHDRVARLNDDLARGSVRLPFDATNGYLRGVLAATGVPVSSQLLVFSETSAQAAHISSKNPRAVYFDDDVAVGWVRGADALELAVHDPEQGVVFYTLEQKESATPRFTRDNSCLLCHDIWETFGVPGFQMLSTFPMEDEKAYASGLVTDHRTPFTERWGGWFVTGAAAPTHHYGNLPVVRPVTSRAPPRAPILTSVKDQFDLTGYPTDTSDVVSLLVLEHQTRMANLITWLGWEARLVTASGPLSASGKDRLDYVASQLVDYMLFVDEAPMVRPVRGTSGFAEHFAARGKTDSKGRSLRQLDLQTRLFRYPCSYMIDSTAFAALPAAAKQAVYTRLWAVLSGADRSLPYQTLTFADRQAIIEILRDTHVDLQAASGTAAR